MGLKLAILSISLITVMAGAAVAPALGSISEAFPEANATTIKLITTLHAFFIIPFLFVTSFLAKKYAKKTLLIIGLALYLVAGTAGGFADSIGWLLATRALLGVSVGLIMPLSTSLVSDFFEGAERTTMMGRVGSSINLGGMISTILAGALAAISWRYTFGVYGLALLILLFVILFLPYVKPEKQTLENGEEKKPKSAPIPASIYGLGGLMFGLFVVFFSIPSNMAIYLQENEIATAEIAGLVIALGTLGGFTAGFLITKTQAVLKHLFLPVMLSFMGVGFALIAFAPSLAAIAPGVIILGFGFGSILPTLFDQVSIIASGRQMVQAMAVVQSFLYLGQFVSPLVLDGLSAGIGDGSTQFVYMMLAVFLLGLGLLLFVYSVGRRILR
ncbi:MFS transporter [Sinobaca sp. H24]|uniref:MFS transporter n=1 Tax=Sinobaca sp. H24 TaxID=2923376 RepID=UPI002079E63E|nr:MFS transporter [Sinobaca sp. H24]